MATETEKQLVLARNFRANVRRILEERNMPQARLAAIMGHSRSYVSQTLDSDSESVDTATIEKWADALDADPIELQKNPPS